MIELVIPSASFLNVRNHCKVSGGLFLLMILAFCLEENIKMIKQTVIMAKKILIACDFHSFGIFKRVEPNTEQKIRIVNAIFSHFVANFVSHLHLSMLLSFIIARISFIKSFGSGSKECMLKW